MKLVAGTPRDLVLKSKQCPCSGSVALRQLNFIHKKGSSNFLKKRVFYEALIYFDFGKQLEIQSMHSRNFGNEIFCKRIIKSLRKV